MSSRSRAWLAALIASSAVGGVPAPAVGASGPELRSRIDPLAEPLVRGKVAVGFVVGILRDGEPRCFGYGETALGSGAAPGPDTLYEIGSITKVFTGVLLAEAVERGHVGLDDPVQAHLPAAVRLPVEGAPITLAHLAEHTSGLPRLPGNMNPSDPDNPYADYGTEQLYAALSSQRLPRAPGEYEYSNYGAGLLGHLLELRSGLGYEQLLIDRVLTPLGMADTRILLHADQRRRLAAPHDAQLGPAKNWDLPALAGAGALRSSCRDLLAFAKANLEPREGPLGRALERARAERRQIGDGLGIGLGWHVAGDRVTRWHDGGTGGYYSWIAIVPSHGLGVVVLANTATEQISRFGELVTRAAAGLDVEPPEIRTEVEVDAARLARFVGRYDLSPDFALVVTLDGGRLMVQATGQDRFPVFPSGPSEFFYKVVDAQLSFVSGADGNIERVILHQGGRDVEGVRRR